jgi:SDR family mycofactocin-dependent oxidoreductase
MGRAHAVRLAEEGADIIAVDICAPIRGTLCDPATPEELEETVREVEKTGRRIVSAVADVRDLPALRAAVDGAVEELGHLDGVVANAGIWIPAPWDQVSPDAFSDTLEVNVVGVWNTVMVGAPHLVRTGGGSIVLTSSAAGLKVQPFMVPYTTSKFAVRGMAKAFAAELAKDNIRVNSLHPTGLATPMAKGAMEEVLPAAIEGNPRLGPMFMNMLPIDSTEAIDQANAVLFLLSDEARYITAHELAVDAGVTQM